MNLSLCPMHRLPQGIISSLEDKVDLLCQTCFKKNQGIAEYGVALDEQSFSCMKRWNQFLLERMKIIRANVIQNGYNSFYILRLDSSFPRNLVCDISKAEIQKAALETIEEYSEELGERIKIIDSINSADSKTLQNVAQRVYKFYLDETPINLKFLINHLEERLKKLYSNKQIYEFTHFIFAKKDLWEIETKRKQLIKQTTRNIVSSRSEEPIACFSAKKTPDHLQEASLHSGIELVKIGSFIIDSQLDASSLKKEVPNNQNIGITEKQHNLLVLQNEYLQHKLQKAEEELKKKQKQIGELNHLIFNEEQLMCYGDDVEVLRIEIKKLIKLKEGWEGKQSELIDLSRSLSVNEKLNKVVGNEGERGYREHEINDLIVDLRKMKEENKKSEEKVKGLQKQNQNLRNLLAKFEGYNTQESVCEQLVEQVVELQADRLQKETNIRQVMKISLLLIPQDNHQQFLLNVKKYHLHDL